MPLLRQGLHLVLRSPQAHPHPH
ncbi:hypothetical protein LEMLEM_LOCUS23910 [Lemmus lemmus]